MAVAAGLDVTNEHYTNHSIQKITMKKLKKADMSATEIMAITGHKIQHSLADYNELDDEDRMRLSEILSSDKTSLSIQLSHVLESVPNHTVVTPPICEQPQPLDALVSLPKYVMLSAPVFNIQNESCYCQKCRNTTLRNAKMHVRRMTMNPTKNRLAAETRCALFRLTALKVR